MLVVGSKYDAKSDGIEACSRTAGLFSRILRKKQRNTDGLRKMELPKMSNGNSNATAISVTNAATPYMSNETSRILTFRCGETWQQGRLAATPEQLAKAGFFYMGEGDRVKCWYCNGALELWDYFDDPWTEHAKWYPSCEYTLHSKGAEFVSSILTRFPNLTRPDPSKVRAAISYVASASRRTSHLATSTSTNPCNIIDPREELQKTEELVNSALEGSNYVKQAREMGFESGNIQEAVRKQYQVKNRNFLNLEELLEALNEIEKESLGASGRQDCRHISNGHSKDQKSQHEKACDPQRSECEDRKCKICYDGEADIVFVPCGHLSTCQHCAQRITTCPLCRSYVREKIKTYIS